MAIEVLVVDDHKIVRDGLRSTIDKRHNMRVTGEASNGEEAIISVQDDRPDAIVMDVDMPVMDGIEATKAITSLTPEVNVIGLSLHKVPTLKEKMYKAGASAYLTKDVNSDDLCATIREEVI